MVKNNINIHEPEFIWNRNRLFLEKEALKQNLKKVISKPEPATKPNDKLMRMIQTARKIECKR
jgi:hypothetical protein